MNKLKKVAVICVATVCLACNNVFAETKEINTATRVRKSASTDSDIVTVLYPGNDVEVLSQEGEWSKIQRGDYTGYVKTEFLKKLEDKDEENEIKNEVANEVKNETVKNEVVNNTTQNTSNTTDNIISEVTENLPENRIAILIKTDLNLLPNFFSKNIQSLDAGVELEILDEINNWYKVSTDNGTQGWILKSKTTNKVLKVDSTINEVTENKNTTTDTNTVEENTQTTVSESTTKKGTINVETANVRESASTSAKRVSFLDYGDEVTILGEENGFYKIKSGDIEGYVSSSLITVQDDKVSSRSAAEERKEEVLQKEAEREQEKTEVEETQILDTAVNTTAEYSVKGEEVATYAKQYLGVAYVLGGKTPETGFDCAGFTKYVFKNFGYTLGSIASAQTSVGTDVTSMSDLKVGDLILFQNEEKTKIGHTGIYLGNGEFVHAANPERGVVTDNLNTSSYYNTRFVIAKRIVD